MRWVFQLICLLHLSETLLWATESPTRSLVLERGSNRVLKIRDLARVAVGNGKVVRARVVSPGQLLLTALQNGQSSVRVWDSRNEEVAYEVSVVAENSGLNKNGLGREGVVKVALEFLELDFSLSQSSGVRWPENVQFSALSTLQGDSRTTGLNYSVAFASAKGWIHHLVKEGWAKIVANPELYVRLGEEANFHSGGEFPVSSTSENYGRTRRHIEWKPWGLTAKVKPMSRDEYHFSSDITLEISEVNMSQAIEGIPGLTRRKLITKMNSLDGETVILSGLLKQSTYAEKAGLPILGSIPVLGTLLFGAKSKAGEESELLMSVTFSMTTRAEEAIRRESYHHRLKAIED